MRPLPPSQPTFNNNAEYYRWLLNELTGSLGLETFSVKQLSEMTQDGSLTGSHGSNNYYPVNGAAATCQYEAVMESGRFDYVLGGSTGAGDLNFRLAYKGTPSGKVYLDYSGPYSSGYYSGLYHLNSMDQQYAFRRFAGVFTTVVARFGNVCETRYGLSERECAQDRAGFQTDGAPLHMQECTEWIREKYGEDCKCVVTLRATVIPVDQAKTLSRDIDAIRSIAQIALEEGSRPDNSSFTSSFEQLGLISRPQSAASVITLTGTDFSDNTGSSTSFERLSMQH